MREKILFDRGKRAERLEIADSSAIAVRLDAGDTRYALIGNKHVAEFSAESVFALHHVAIEDDASAVAGTDDVGNRGLAAVGSEDRVVSPKRGGVGIVQV